MKDELMTTQLIKCGLCNRIQQIKDDVNPYFVAEMKSGFVVMGDHQFFRGYSLLLLKEHYTELHQLDHKDKMIFLEEMSILSEAVYKVFKPKKLNYELLGNSIDHLHWHIFPRYEDDPNPKGPVWVLDKNILYAESARPRDEELLVLKRDLFDALQHLAENKIIRKFTEKSANK